MKFAPLLFLLINFRGTLASLCHPQREKVYEMSQIQKAREKIFKSPDFKEFKSEYLSVQKMFLPSVKEVCSEMSEEKVAADGYVENPALGFGSYGQVFLVEFKDPKSKETEVRAVKQLSLQSYLKSKLTRKFPSEDPIVVDCIRKVLEKSVSPRIFTQVRVINATKTKKGTTIQIDHTPSLNPFNTKILTVSKCLAIRNFKTTVEHYVNRFFKELRTEIQVNLNLSQVNKSQLANNRKVAFTSFEMCIIDNQNNVFLVMEQMGNSVQDLNEECSDPINQNKLRNRLTSYMQILFQVHKMHEFGYTHCDIKPHNILFKKNSYNHFSITDFGKTTMEMCDGGTSGFWPPEGFLDIIIDPIEIDEISQLPELRKYDSFSLAMTILVIDLGILEFRSIYHHYMDLEEEYQDPEEFMLHEEYFFQLVDEKLERINKLRYLKSKRVNELKVELLLQSMLFHMLKFNYTERIAVKTALYYVYRLLLAVISEKASLPAEIDDYLESKGSLNKRVQSPEWLSIVEEILYPKDTKAVRKLLV